MDALAHSLEAYCSPFFHPFSHGIAIESINKDHPDADCCIHGGDITDKGDVESYERFHNIIKKLKIPP